ncbi:unconventional myosin-Vc [Protopterus annectens]|uniref:unconventional myosin-Vc n=1 Tax=Protopterus annectens TaxID=7888 RepID=UPI001CF9FAE1|nr:unconventional myosin-Vc [Protopterus annectens]
MSNRAFIVQHFADKVQYECDGFLEKNRDTLYEELIKLVKTSKFHLLANFFQDDETPMFPSNSTIKVKPARPGVKPTNKQLRMTVGSKFRGSLYLLMETLNATTPHYVRCIKPNDDKLPFEYDCKRVDQQLRACGVLETIRISAQSYPSRWTYIEFYSRYRILMTQQELSLNEKKQICKIVLQRLIQDPNQYQFGRTKIFFRAGQVAYLEKVRSDRLRAACIIIQKNVRCWIQRKKYLRFRNAAIIIQQYVRGQRAVRQAVSAAALKQTWGAIVIQRHARGFLVRRLYQLILVATVTVQAFTRGYFARKKFRRMLQEHKATILQKHARAWLARRRFQSIRRVVLNIQLSYRVQQLQKKLEDQNKQNHGLLERLTTLASTHSADTDKLHKLESECEKSVAQKKKTEEQLKKLKEENDQTITKLQKQNVDLVEQKQELEKNLHCKTVEMEEKMNELTRQVLGDLEKEEEQRKALENSLHFQREDYEAKIKAMREEIRSLKEENKQLKQDVQNGAQVNDGFKREVEELSKQAKVIPQLKREISLLETQRKDIEKQMQEQVHDMRAKMTEVTKQLLRGLQTEDLRQRLSPEELQQLNEDGEVWFAYEGLKKATRVLEVHYQAQRESYENEIETLNLKTEHLSQEIGHLQALFKEENNTKHSIKEELARLTKENMVIPELKQHISELQKQKMEIENCSKKQAVDMQVKLEELSGQLTQNLEDTDFQKGTLEIEREIHKKEKEDLVSTLAQIQEASDHLKQQYQEESEARAVLWQEVSRLASENKDLEEQVDMKEKTIKKLQDQVNSLTKSIEKAKQEQAPPVPKVYIGMLEYKPEDEPKLTKNLILDLKPRGVVVNLIPGLPANILFMCVRYADHLNDAGRLKSLMNSTINAIKQVIKTHHTDFEMMSFWLSNTSHFLNCLKQYSGEEEFMKYNSVQQNKNCLKNFDLSEYRQILSDLAIRIYHQFLNVMERQLQPMIVSGMLEQESLQGMSSMKPTGFRKRSSSIEDLNSYTISSILHQLDFFHNTMCQHGMDQELIKQTVKQLFYLIGAITLNNLFLRKDMCSCRKGMQIRCNISYVEEWLQEKSLQNSAVKETMEPLSQAAWLLQVNKTTEEDAKEICNQCSSLSSVQIVKILNSYTPIDDFEKRVAPSFVRKVQSMLQSREDGSQLLMDTNYQFQVTFPFTPSPHTLETIQVPSSLKLGFLTRI